MFKSYSESVELNQIAALVPMLEKLEPQLEEQGISMDDYLVMVMEKSCSESQLNEFLGTMAATALGGYLAKKGLDKVGGWQGIKNAGRSAVSGLQQTGRDMKAAVASGQRDMARANAEKNAKLAGGTVNWSNADPTSKDRSHAQTFLQSVADSAQEITNNMGAKLDPQQRRDLAQILNLTRNLKMSMN